jgi:hypothetical protein
VAAAGRGAASDSDSDSVWEHRPFVDAALACSLGTSATCAQASLGFVQAAAVRDDQRPHRCLRAGPASARPHSQTPGFAAFGGSAAAASHSGFAAVCGPADACFAVAVRSAGATAGLGEAG